MQFVKGAISIVVLLAVMAFSLQNLHTISISFLAWSISVPQVVVIIGTYLLGMLTGAWFVDFLKYLFKSKQAKPDAKPAA